MILGELEIVKYKITWTECKCEQRSDATTIFACIFSIGYDSTEGLFFSMKDFDGPITSFKKNINNETGELTNLLG